MAQDTKIEWAHHTFNPWRGCTKVSAGCANCYADTLSKRNPLTLGVWGPNGTRVVAAEAAWRKMLYLDRLAAQVGERRRVFCASLADVFEDWRGLMADSHGDTLFVRDGKWTTHADPDDDPPLTMQDVRQRLFDLIDRTPNLDYLLLTKRPENVPAMMPPRFAWVETGVKIWQLESPVGSRHFCGIVWGDTDNPRFAVPGGYTVCHHDGRIEERGEGGFPTVAECKAEVEKRFGAARPNVWIGTSVEDRSVLHRIDTLRTIPAKVRFLSIEPLLEDLGKLDLTGIHWVIVGGESGHHARPCNIDWIRDIVRQCKAAGVLTFVKQIGSNPVSRLDDWETWPGGNGLPSSGAIRFSGDGFGNYFVTGLRDPKGGDPLEWPADLRVREVPKARA